MGFFDDLVDENYDDDVVDDGIDMRRKKDVKDPFDSDMEIEDLGLNDIPDVLADPINGRKGKGGFTFGF